MIKKILIPATIIVIIGIAILSFYLWNNKIVSTITLDINPSIEINLTRNEKVKSAIALNDDAKEIINNDLKNISLEEAINNITEKVIENGYADNDEVVILVYSDDNNSVSNATKLIEQSFSKNQVKTEIIKIDKISKEDKELAEKYNITPAKASYINKVLDENKNVKEESLIEKSISELKETKETGKYCDTGYFLEGDFCYKEIKKEKADIGDVCPAHSVNRNDKCYETLIPIELDELECEEGLSLVNNKCVGTIKHDALSNFSCKKGTLITRGEAKYRDFRDSKDWNEFVCEDTSTGQKPTLRCLQKNHIMVGGKCADGPKPTINGGCPNNDVLYNNGCYTIDPDNDNSEYICPDNSIYKKSEINLCPDTFTYTKAEGSYSCKTGETLEGTKCLEEVVKEPYHKITCSTGYVFEDNQCINYNKEVSMVQGYKCDKENTKLKNNYCITYDIIDAKK